VPDHLWAIFVEHYKNVARKDPIRLYQAVVSTFMMGEAPRGHVLRSIPLMMSPPDPIFVFEEDSLCPEQVASYTFLNQFLHLPGVKRDYHDDYSFSLAGPLAAFPQALSQAADLPKEPREVCVCNKGKDKEESKETAEKKKETEESTDKQETKEGEKEKEDSEDAKKKPVSLKLCGRCKEQRYCSPECQKADWPRHKIFCNMLKQDEFTRTSYLKSLRDPTQYTDGWKPPRDPFAKKGNYYCVDCGREHGVFNEHLQQDLNENAPQTILLPHRNEDGVLEGMKVVVSTNKKKKNKNKRK